MLPVIFAIQGKLAGKRRIFEQFDSRLVSLDSIVIEVDEIFQYLGGCFGHDMLLSSHDHFDVKTD